MGTLVRTSIVAAVFAATSSLHAGLQPQYTVTSFGLTDGLHINSSGNTANILNVLSTTVAPGPVYGGWANVFYPGIPTNGIPGRTAWIYDGANLTTIGLYGSEFVNSNSNHYSMPGGQPAGGGITGVSYIYSGTSQTGQATWYYNGTQTIELGLKGTGYLSGSTRYSTISALPGNPLITGTSRRDTGTTTLTKGAWVYNPADSTTTQLGYYDATHHDTYGTYTSVASRTAGSYVAGYSNRYSGATPQGRSAWLYNASTHIQTRVGFTGGIYTSGVNEDSLVNGLNSDGTAIGNSANNFNLTGNYWAGSTAWTRSGSTGQYTTLGLGGSQYLSPTGVRFDQATQLNTAGQVAGYSGRWNSSINDFRESDAWLYSSGSYQTIPVPSSSVTDPYSSFAMRTMGISNGGDVAGIVGSYNAAGTNVATAAWVYHGGATYATGIIDAAHTNPNTGKVMSVISQVSDYGLVTGTSYKYTSTGSTGGSDAWVFNTATGTTSPLALGNYGDAQGSTYPAFITPEGFVGGFFDIQLSPTITSFQGFLWSQDTGVVNFDSLFAGGLASQDISRVVYVTWVNPSGDIYATVLKTNGNYEAVVFQGAVPEPGIALLASAVAIPALARRSRRLTAHED